MSVSTIGAWALWRERRRVIALVIAVEAVATILPAIAWSPIRRSDIALALLLASLSVTYSVFVVGWEKAHRLLLFERAPAMTPDVLAVWCFAAALLLPPSLAAAVTAAAAIGDLPSYNPAGSRPLYRYLYSAFGSILAATAASWSSGINCHLVRPLPLPRQPGY